MLSPDVYQLGLAAGRDTGDNGTRHTMKRKTMAIREKMHLNGRNTQGKRGDRVKRRKKMKKRKKRMSGKKGEKGGGGEPQLKMG
jgi:hypothetical protein